MLHVALAFLAVVAQEPDSIAARRAMGATPPDTVAERRDTTSLPPTAEQLADAYADEGARELVRRARERRRTVDRSVDAYRTLARERISAGLRVPGRDRTLFLRETATQIDWRREGPIHLKVLGAREAIPPLMGSQQVPAALRRFVPRLAFDPESSEMLLRLDDDGLRNPIGPNAERHYRYASGDTTEIRLPDGRSVRLLELRVFPRRADFHLIRGSFWIEEQSAAIVQATFRPSRKLDPDRGSAPRLLRPLGLDIEYITLEYAFWDFRWWMPRVLAAEGVFQATSHLKVPFQYALHYSEYEVEGDATRPPDPVARDSAGSTTCMAGGRLVVQVTIGGGRTEPPGDTAGANGRRGAPAAQDPTGAGAPPGNPDDATAPPSANADSAARRPWDVDERTGAGYDRCGRTLQVDLPADSASLLTSELLPRSIFETDAAWDTELRRIRELADWLGGEAGTPWRRPEVAFDWGFGLPGGVRYNRVEGLAIGARVAVDAGRLRADATGRLALAEPRPDVELALTRPIVARDYRLSLYNGVRLADPATRAFGLGNSFNALLLGRDDGEYYQALGASLEVRPASLRPQRYALRLFAERHDAVATATDFSLPSLWDRERTFRPNVVADRADLFGAALTLAGSLGADPTRWRVAGVLDLEGAGGDFEYGRAALTIRAGLPTIGRIAPALEAAAGTSTGDVPVQRLFYLGGPATLRGYAGNAARGDAFWRARGEIGYGGAFGRIALFGDVARAGPRSAFTTDSPLRSIGIGTTLFDGIIRADVARALDGARGWRTDVWVDLEGM